MASKRVSLKGKGADLFFGDYNPSEQSGAAPIAQPRPSTTDSLQPDESPTPLPIDESPVVDEAVATTAKRPSRRAGRTDGKTQSTDIDTIAIQKSIRKASVLASTLSLDDQEIVAAIRKVVKVPGREVSFVRLTPEEKAHLANIVYTYKRQGVKTTETEINRIALNYLLHDYHEHGEQSVLARVLAALLA